MRRAALMQGGSRFILVRTSKFPEFSSNESTIAIRCMPEKHTA